MLRSDVWGAMPGIGGAAETYEAAFRWGQFGVGIITGGIIAAGTVDAGNTPTYEIRQGLVLGQIISSGEWTNYSPTATDGSDVAAGVLMSQFRMQAFTGSTERRFYGILVGGPVQAAKLLGLDLMARQQMDKFMFDDSPGGYPGNHWFPWKRFQSKTANYTIVAADNFTLFDNTGAVGAVTFTLPALANGYCFGFRVTADQTVTVASAEGDNIVAFNDAAADSLAFSTGGQKVGGGLALFSNPAVTQWIAINQSAGTNTVTVAT
jgi:hypothetical protein